MLAISLYTSNFEVTTKKLNVRAFILSGPGTMYLSQWRTQKIFMGGGFIQWHTVVICLWCAVFVTSRFDVIFMFPNQRFGEVCWHNMHIPLQALPYFMSHCTEYKLSALQVRISEENKLNATTQEFISANVWLRVEKGE